MVSQTTVHPVELRPICKIEFVCLGPVEKPELLICDCLNVVAQQCEKNTDSKQRI